MRSFQTKIDKNHKALYNRVEKEILYSTFFKGIFMKRFLMVLVVAIVSLSLFASTWYAKDLTDEWGDPSGEVMYIAFADWAKYTNSSYSNKDLNYAALVVYPANETPCSMRLSAYSTLKGAGYTSFNDLDWITITIIYNETEYTMDWLIQEESGILAPFYEEDCVTFASILNAVVTNGGRLRIKGTIEEGTYNTAYYFKAQFDFPTMN